MSNDMNVEETARELYKRLNPNISLKEVEERVWRLRCRNLSRGQIYSILSEEFTKKTKENNQEIHSQSTGSEEPDWITVESLPDEYRRKSWR